MKNGAKRMLSGVVAVGLSVSAFAGMALAEEEKPSADLTVAALSQYVWRGFAFSKDSMVVQPSMTVGYQGFSANLWGNLDTDPYTTDGANNPNNWTETDMTLAYDWAMGPVSFTGGYIYYALDGAEDTQEFFLSAALDTLLAPTLSVFRDTDNLAGWYVTLGVSHSVPLVNELTIDLGARISYLAADEASSYGEVVGGVESETEEYSGLHDGIISASLTVPVNTYISVTPQVYYSFPLGSDASDLLEVRNEGAIGKRDDDFIYGGVSVSLAF
ncbi:hypothetical protein ACUUL3_01360 [Thiovibrio sp. JS02]